jgi:hypothetical protein
MCLPSSLKTNLMAVKQDSSNQVMQRLYKRELEPRLDTLPMKSLEGFSRVCADPKYTFLESVLYYTVLKSQRLIPCDVIVVPETQKREVFQWPSRKEVLIRDSSTTSTCVCTPLTNGAILLCVCDIYSRSGRDISCSDSCVLWYYSVPLGKCWGSVSIRPQTLPSKSYPIYYSPLEGI